MLDIHQFRTFTLTYYNTLCISTVKTPVRVYIILKKRSKNDYELWYLLQTAISIEGSHQILQNLNWIFTELIIFSNGL